MILDVFPATVYVDRPGRTGHPGYNKVRVFVRDDHTLFVIMENGTLAETVPDVSTNDGLGGYSWSNPDGTSVIWSKGRGCNCQRLASEITRDRLIEGTYE